MDPVATEIARWQEFVRTNQSTDEDWKSTQEIVLPVLVRAEKALKDGRNFYALHLLAAARPLVGAQKYVQERSGPASPQMETLEAEWQKVGGDLQPVIGGNEAFRFDDLPAAAQAVAETALAEIKPYYEASLEYGKNTAPEYGLYYLGSATSQHDFVRFVSTLRGASEKKQISVSNFPNEIHAFEDELLSAYKPPLSIDQHPLFIRISATIKEAREMYDAGLRYGALYKYLDARVRFARLKGEQQSIDAPEAERRAAEVTKRFGREPADHSIGSLYIEMALAEIPNPAAGTNGGATAKTIFEDVLPHYLAALQPSKPQPAKPNPEIKVTLIRWPYT